MLKYLESLIFFLGIFSVTEVWGKNRVVDQGLTPEEFASFAHANTSFKWIQSVDTWYVPMLNLPAAEQFREILVGDPAPKANESRSQYDWSNFCLIVIFHDPATFYEGLNEVQVAKCKVSRSPTVYGTCNYMSDRTNRIHKAYVMSAETDNENYSLTIRKWIDPPDVEIDWWVVSPHKTLSNEIKAKILQHLKDFGFSTSDIITVNYDQCKTRKRCKVEIE